MKKKILRAAALLGLFIALGACSSSNVKSHGKDCGDVCYYLRIIGR